MAGNSRKSNNNRSNTNSILSLKKLQKIQIIIISEFNWCTLNLHDTLLKFCLSLPSNFTLEQLSQKTLTTIQNIYYLKNVKISRFRDAKGYDIMQNFKGLNNNKLFYTSILEAEDNKQTQLDQFKLSLDNGGNGSNRTIQKSFQVLDLQNQMNLPSFSNLIPLNSNKSQEFNNNNIQNSNSNNNSNDTNDSSNSSMTKKKANISKAKLYKKSKIISVPSNPNKKSKLKNKISMTIKFNNNGGSDSGGEVVKKATSPTTIVNKVQKK